jgi:hypothetical protein
MLDWLLGSDSTDSSSMSISEHTESVSRGSENETDFPLLQTLLGRLEKGSEKRGETELRGETERYFFRREMGEAGSCIILKFIILLSSITRACEEEGGRGMR